MCVGYLDYVLIKHNFFFWLKKWKWIAVPKKFYLCPTGWFWTSLEVGPPHPGDTGLGRIHMVSSFVQAGRHLCRTRLLLSSRALLGLTCSCLLVSVSEYTVINEACPGAEWNIMCRECCEYDQIECVCPGKKEVVGYTIPCCRNEENECDSCLIHPGECARGDFRLPARFLKSPVGATCHLNADRLTSGGWDTMMIKGP